MLLSLCCALARKEARNALPLLFHLFIFSLPSSILSVCLPVVLIVWMPFPFLSIYLYISLFIYLCQYLSMFLVRPRTLTTLRRSPSSLLFTISLSLSICLFIQLITIFVSVFVFICPSVLSIYLQTISKCLSRLGRDFNNAAEEPVFSETHSLDLATVVSSLSGPKRPHDRYLCRAKKVLRGVIAARGAYRNNGRTK